MPFRISKSPLVHRGERKEQAVRPFLKVESRKFPRHTKMQILPKGERAEATRRDGRERGARAVGGPFARARAPERLPW